MRSSSLKKGADSSSAHPESPHSPLRLHSPLRSDLGDPQETPPYASPAASPENPKFTASTVDKHTQWSPSLSPLPRGWNASSKGPPTVNRAVRENWMSPYTVKDRPPDDHVQEQARRPAPVTTGPRSRSVDSVQKVALGFRVLEVFLCLISFSVMAADKTKGWSGDSFNRYKEYRYCLAVNVIAFVYSSYQTGDMVYHMITGKHVSIQPIHASFDFLMDQVLAYLLISASSSAASRVDDWVMNWGKDKFTEMASASIAMSFLAFVGFAISSLISGFFLFTTSDIAA